MNDTQVELTSVTDLLDLKLTPDQIRQKIQEAAGELVLSVDMARVNTSSERAYKQYGSALLEVVDMLPPDVTYGLVGVEGEPDVFKAVFTFAKDDL